MIFKQNMIVVITNGRHAGKKGVVVKELDENTILVAGVERVPVETADYMPSWQKRRNEKFVTFIKRLNVRHALATRYKADIGLSEIDFSEVVTDADAKRSANSRANSVMKDAYEARKSKWLFTTLAF
ncbi:large subunit ribosomal protein L27e [Pancytospora epiphaga]|nr:large subunit ribosomal protein L27e [Pancytospora epiphaga]